MAKQTNQRSEERVAAALPVKFGDAIGISRDVSANGICFEVDASCSVGNEIAFEVGLETGGQRMMLKCRGTIVRTEARGKKIGVAVKITESVLEAAS